MMASLFQAGFEVVEVTVTDILGERQLNLESFRGLIFPGGFSFADVLGSARGWAASLKFNQSVSQQLERFRNRANTFSLGVCNGCQLLAMLGWVGAKADGRSLGPRLPVTHCLARDTRRIARNESGGKQVGAIRVTLRQRQARGEWSDDAAGDGG